MLTVKQCLDNGAENLYTTDKITVIGREDGKAEPGADNRIIRFFAHPDGKQVDISTGTVFVMNDRGSTVAHYRGLGAFKESKAPEFLKRPIGRRT